MKYETVMNALYEMIDHCAQKSEIPIAQGRESSTLQKED
jgi:hypothetical protein